MIVPAKAVEISAETLLSGKKALQGIGDQITALVRHEKFGDPTKVDRGGIAVGLAKSGLLVRDLGVTQSHIGTQLLADSQGIFHGGNLDRIADHVAKGVNALDGALRHRLG